ncbi:MAG: hypothetical protein HOP03_12035 [Lysobacter sp.]|nr:hypothetical protein [Lysobacter sp.]
MRLRKGRLRAALLAALLAPAACSVGGGEPGQSDLESALREHLDHYNDRGGVKINLGSAGGFRDIRFDIRLHSVSKRGCTGGDRVYVCEITYNASFPPVKTQTESIDTKVTMFDGPGGWRVIE